MYISSLYARYLGIGSIPGVIVLTSNKLLFDETPESSLLFKSQALDSSTMVLIIIISIISNRI